MWDIYSFWTGFGPETKAALIGAVSTFGVGIIGFGGLILQMRSQSKQSRDAIAENERRRLKAAMYEDAVAVCRELADNAIGLANSFRMLMLQVGYAAQGHENGRPYDLPAARYPILAEKYNQLVDSALKFIFLVENRRIVDPRLLIFRTAMNVALHDAEKVMNSEFVSDIFVAIPVQLPDGTMFPYTPPSVKQATVIQQICERFIVTLDDTVMYTEDFLVELQNALLGDLFANQITHRQPIDPTKRVISLEDAEKLEQWFATSTDWGKNNARIEAETAARFLA